MVIAGQGTIGLEIAEQAPATTTVVVAIGGGALAAGVAIAVKARLPGVRVVGVQSDRCAPYPDSLAAQQPIGARSAGTICDGIAVKRPGELTVPLVAEHVDEVVTVSDDEVAQAMVLLLERSKLVVEGAGAASVAALLAGKIEPPDEGEVCAVLSGGNVDATRLAECIRLGETAAGRRLVFSTVVPDQPGALARLVGRSPSSGANVLDVVHIREGVDLHVRETGIRLVLQTDGPEHGERVLAAVREQGFAVIPQEARLSDARGAAAGGLVVRDRGDGPELAVVHRPRYDDWSLPKGKLEPRGGWEQAALREVEEETGLRCELGRELEPARYRDRKGRTSSSAGG